MIAKIFLKKLLKFQTNLLLKKVKKNKNFILIKINKKVYMSALNKKILLIFKIIY